MVMAIPLFVVASVFDSPGTLLGWTADGQSLVWQSGDSATTTPKLYYLEKDDGERVDVADPSKLSAADRKKLVEVDPADMMGPGPDPEIDETATLVIVHDIRTGTDTKFMTAYKAVSKKGKAEGTLKKKYATLGDGKAFDAWKKQHPLAKTPGKKGKAGEAGVTIKLTSSDDGPPKWVKSSISWSVMDSATVTLSTTCGKDTNREVIEQQMGAMYSPSWTATPYWEPTGHRVLFVLEEAVAKTMRGPDGGRVSHVVVPCGPRVQVVATAGLEQAAAKVADAVEKAGPTVVEIGAAKQARTQTVIYADAAHTELATKLAASIPGGATVDKLTWKPKADLVVAVGASAK